MDLQIGKLRFLAGLLLGCTLLTAPLARAAGAPHSRVFVPVVLMHHVKPDKPGDNAIEMGLTIPPVTFQKDIGFIAAHGYHTISTRALASYLRSGGTVPSKPLALTFDDGYADMYTDVYPVLRRYHMTATFFVIAGLVGKPRYLTWQQILDMARHGMDIEAHTMTHPDLTIVPRGQVWGEIDESRRVLQARLHRPVDVFAYPYGSYNSLVLSDVKTAGYWAAFTTHQGWWQQSNQMLTLPRVYVDRDDTLPILAGRLTGDPATLAEDPS